MDSILITKNGWCAINPNQNYISYNWYLYSQFNYWRSRLYICKKEIRGEFNKFPDFFVQALNIVLDSWKFSKLLLYIFWDDWPIVIISASNEQLQQQLEYTLLKPDFHNWWISKMHSGREDTLEERYVIKFSLKLGKNATETYGILQTAFQPFCMNRSHFLRGIRDARMAGRLWGMMKVVEGVRKSIHHRWRAKGLGLLCWSFKWVQEEFLGKRPALFKSGQWHFHQDNTPVHNYILVTDYFTKMGIKTVPQPRDTPDVAPCDFWLFLSSEAVVMGQLRRWKRLWRRSLTRSAKRTSMGPFRSCWNGTISALQLEEITLKGTTVSCVYYQ